MNRKVLPSFSLTIQKEASVSPYCSKVLKSFTNFQKSNDPKNEETAFQSFLNDFSDFINNETNKNLINSFSIPMIQICFNYSIKFTFNGNRMALLFSMLDKILNANMIKNTNDFSVFMFSLMSDSSKVQILTSNQKVLEKLFSNHDFFYDFVVNKHVYEFFDISFLTFVSTDLCRLFRVLICEKSPITLRSTINLHEIIASLSIPIKPEAQIEDALVVSHLISANTLNRFFLNNTQSFNLFSDYIKTADFSIIKTCFNELIFSPPRNLEFFSNILLFYQKYPKHQIAIFHWIFNELIKNSIVSIDDMNEIMPIFIWVTHSTPISDLLSVLIYFSKDPNKEKYVKPFIQPLFTLLCKGNSDYEIYDNAVHIVEQQIIFRRLSLTNLYDSFFLQAFVIKTKVEILAKLFEKQDTFSQLVYDIYSLPKAEKQRPNVIQKLIEMVVAFPQTAHFIYAFIIITNSKDIILQIMNLILEKHNHELCEALGNVFLRSSIMIKYFIEENGVNWLNKVFNLKIINVTQFRYLINTLTMRTPVKSIDKYIEHLPKNHEFFKETETGFKTLLYGFIDANARYPMKILPLFTYLPLPNTIDPYKAYRIGKHLIDRHPELIDSPIMKVIANQYVTDSTFLKLIQKDAKSIERYINTSLDQFPIFQVYEFSEEHPFNLDYSSLSFWIKFDSEMVSEFKLPFFHSEKLQLFIKNTIIITNYDGTEYYENINPYNWNNITISIKQQKISHEVKISINSSKVTFSSIDPIDHFSHFEFSVYASFLYIGPCIRVYQNSRIKSKDRSEIYQKGPSYQGPLSETFIISPSSKKYLIPGKNVLPVKYKGFASHFISKRKATLFLNRLSFEEFSQEDFVLMVKSLSSIYSVLKNSMRNFLTSMLTVFSKQSKHVTVNILAKILSFVSHFKPKSEIVSKVISHKELWDNVSNEIIVSSLFQAFKDFNFLKQKEQFDMFLIYRSYLNPTNQKMIEALFKATHKCQTYICQFLIASHLISPKNDRSAQCSLGLTSISKLSSSKEQKQTQDNVVYQDKPGFKSELIQCNLDVDTSSSQIHLLTLEFPNSEFTYSFQNLKSTDYQMTIIKQLKVFLTATKLVNLVPLNEILNVFTLLDDQIKVEIFPLLIEYELLSPNSIRIDFSFLSIVSKLYGYKSIWDESFRIVSIDSSNLSKSYYLPLLFSLLWGYTVASLHSVGSTGEPLSCPEYILNIIEFLTKHIKVISNDRNTQKFVASWFPFLFGLSSPSPDNSSFASTEISNIDGFVAFDQAYSSQMIKFNQMKTVPPSPFSFITNLWNDIISKAKLPHIKNEYIDKLKQYVIHSKIYCLYILFAISVSDIRNFTEIFSAFLLGPYISKSNDITKGYMITFLNHVMAMIAPNYHKEMNIEAIFPFIHYLLELKLFDQIDLSNILATSFLVASVINSSNQVAFRKLIPHFHLLLVNLITASLNHENQNQFLVNLLNQNIKNFSKIVSETPKGIDIYLNFLYEIGKMSQGQDYFSTFFSSFVDYTKCQNHPIAKRIISKDFNDEPKNNSMCKSQIEQILSQLKSMIFESRQIALNEIRETAKEYTISFISYSQKVTEASMSISNLIQISQLYASSRVDWMCKVHDLQLESKKNLTDSNIKDQLLSTRLVPFVLPFNLPRLFLPNPSLIENDNDVLAFINRMNLYKFPLKLADDIVMKPQFIPIESDIINCTITRVSISFCSILVFRQTDFLLIPYSRSIAANPPLQAEIVLPFMKEVIDGSWGSTLLYQNRVLIRIAYDTLYRIQKIGNDSIALWSFPSGHFMISNMPSFALEFFSKLDSFSRYPLKSPLSISSKADVITRWEKSQISNSELMIGLNLFNNRTICDPNNFIVWPEHLSQFALPNPIIETLKTNLAGNSNIGTFPFSNTVEDNTIIEFAKNQFGCDLDGSKRLNRSIFDRSSAFFKREIDKTNGPMLDPLLFNELMVDIPPISAKLLDDERKIYVVVDKEKMKLSIIDYSIEKDNSVIYEESLPLFASSKYLHSSDNGLFFSLDFDCDITYIYQVIYKKGHPKSFRFIRDLSFEMRQETKISGIDWIAATRKNDKLILWPFFRNTIHRIIKFDDALKSIGFDEDASFIWALSMKRKYFDNDGNIIDIASSKDDLRHTATKRQNSLVVTLVDVNGHILGLKAIDFEVEELPMGDDINAIQPNKKVTMLKVIPQSSSINTRLAICGFNDGSLYLLSVDSLPLTDTQNPVDIQYQQFDSPHQKGIKNILVQRNSPHLITIDMDGKQFIWSQKEFPTQKIIKSQV